MATAPGTSGSGILLSFTGQPATHRLIGVNAYEHQSGDDPNFGPRIAKVRLPLCAGMISFFRFVLPRLGWAVCVLTACMTAQSARADTRVALVVGNSNYAHVQALSNPSNDARLIAKTLADLGFTLVGGREQLDLDKASFDQAVQSFGNAIQGADVALFYYAGHGLQVRGANYLVPVGANPTKLADVDFQMLDVNLVLREMESAGVQLNVLILDACRNNPFGERGLRSFGRGLAQMQAPEGTLISFATQPGNIAQDGSGANSPFTNALAQTIRKPGLDIFRAFNEVGLAVASATKGEQQPWLSLSPIKGDFYFAGVGPAESLIRPARDPADIVRLAKIHLQEVGCDPGDLSEKWDPKARRALGEFNTHAGTHLDLDSINNDTLEALRARSGRICPLVCVNGMRPEGDRCVAMKCEPGFTQDSSGKCQSTKPKIKSTKTKSDSKGASATTSSSPKSAASASGASDLLYRCRSKDRSACQTLCNAGFSGPCRILNRTN